MPESPPDFRTLQRRVRIEAGAWGALIALNTAFVSLLLISRGAEAFALAIYASGASLFGLSAGLLGPKVAALLGSIARVTLVALVTARLVFVAVPLVTVTTDGALPLLIAALLVWSAGEGIALPLWTAFLAGLSDPTERSRWLAGRATAAAIGAACVILPMLLLVRLTSIEHALQAAYVAAALAAVVSTLQVRALFRLIPARPAPQQGATPGARSVPGIGFLGGVFAFWFGAALNRPILPPYVIHELHAPAAYFATAAVVAAISGAGLQRWWGGYGSTKGARPLLGLSGVGAGLAPLLWTVVPDYRFGIPLEAAAAGFWLGHLLGLTLHTVELAQDDAERASVIARTQVTQGAAATLAPLIAAGIVGLVGATPILIASGVICLAATAVMTESVRWSGDLSSIFLRTRRLRTRLDSKRGGRIESVEGFLEPAVHNAATASVLLRAGDVSREDLVRARLPVVLKRALSADCPSCRGIGCGMCYGMGLG